MICISQAIELEEHHKNSNHLCKQYAKFWNFSWLKSLARHMTRRSLMQKPVDKLTTLVSNQKGLPWWVSWMMQCLFKSIHLCWSSSLLRKWCFLQKTFFHMTSMIHNHIVALIRIYYFSCYLLYQTDGPGSQNVCHARQKIPCCCTDNTNCLLKKPPPTTKRKQVEKRFFAKDKQLKSLSGLSAWIEDYLLLMQH